MDEQEKHVWDVTAHTLTTFRVYFDAPVTEEQAKWLFMAEEYDDIMDEDVLEYIDVACVE